MDCFTLTGRLLGIYLFASLLFQIAWAAPSTTLKGFRVKPVGDGTQIIFDLSQLPTDLKIQEQPNGQISATFAGQLTKGLKKTHFQKLKAPNLQHVYWENKKGKIQLFVKTNSPEAATIYPLKSPNRLIFHVRKQSTQVTQADDISPGVKHTRMVKATARGPLLVNVVEVDPRNPLVEIAPALAHDKMGAKAKAETIIRESNAIAGINGSFFKPDQGIPLGLLIIQGELISGPIYERVALGMGKNRDLKMNRIKLTGELSLSNAGKIVIDNVNQPRVSAHQIVVYSPRWGTLAPPIPKNGIQVQMRNGHVVAQSTTERLTIPKDGYVVSGPKTEGMMLLANQPLETDVSLSFYTTPDWSDVQHAIAGGPYLVKNGQPYIDTKAEHFGGSGLGTYAPRTAVAITNGGKLLLVTVDGRQRHSVGVSFGEMATILKNLGAKDAMNLDGGSSTQMVVEGQLVNSPSVKNGVAVSNCLVIRRSTDMVTTTQPVPLNR